MKTVCKPAAFVCCLDVAIITLCYSFIAKDIVFKKPSKSKQISSICICSKCYINRHFLRQKNVARKVTRNKDIFFLPKSKSRSFLNKNNKIACKIWNRQFIIFAFIPEKNVCKIWKSSANLGSRVRHISQLCAYSITAREPRALLLTPIRPFYNNHLRLRGGYRHNHIWIYQLIVFETS